MELADHGGWIVPNQGRSGSFTKWPGFESNLTDVPIGSKVYFPPKIRDDIYIFVYGGVASSGNESPAQYQYQLHQMVAQNQDGWDFARCHPVIE